jgi:hypothetical protein
VSAPSIGGGGRVSSVTPYASYDALVAAAPAAGGWVGSVQYQLRGGDLYFPVFNGTLPKKFAGFGASNMNNAVTFWLPAVFQAGFEAAGRFGLAGKTTAELLADTYLDPLRASDATHVILGPGYNDMMSGRTVAQYQASMMELIREVCAMGKIPLLVSIQDNETIPGVANEYNVSTWLLARKYGIQWNDVFRHIMEDDGDYKPGYNMDTGPEVHMAPLAASIAANLYAQRLIDGKSDIPLPRASGATGGTGTRLSFIENQAMVLGSAGAASGYTYYARAINRSVEVLNAYDGNEAIFQLQTTGSESNLGLIYARKTDLDAEVAYKMAVFFRLRYGILDQDGHGSAGVALTMQINTDVPEYNNSEFFRSTAEGVHEVATIVDVSAGATRHDYAFLATDTGIFPALVEVGLSSFAAVNITGLIY